MNRICYQSSVTSGQPLPLTKTIWDQLIDSPEVKNICTRIAELDPTAEDYNDRKQALKKRLPIIIPHARAFKNGKRVSADATPSGLAMLDVDHVDNPREWWAKLFNGQINEKMVNEQMVNNKIYLVAITASGHGIRIIGERMAITNDQSQITNYETIEAAQLRIATALGIVEYDAVTKDLARASYVVPRDYILWIYEEGLFSEKVYADQSPLQLVSFLPALPPHVETKKDTSYASDGLEYRGIPYSAIVEQLLIATGNGGGAVQGERNTVYFSLANYMRYICDFNAELLLKVLPDFGLSESERRQAIASAIGRPRKSQMPLVLQSAIAVCERELANDKSQITNDKSTMLKLPPLPRLLKLICRRLPEEFQPAMVIASLPILGTLATRVRFEYLDRQEQSLSFFSCITAPAASGKSFIRKPLDLLLTPINEQDALERKSRRIRINCGLPRTPRTNPKTRTLVRATTASQLVSPNCSNSSPMQKANTSSV